MNPQEIQKQNFESPKTQETKEAKETKNENNNLPKSATLSKYPNFDMFVKTLNTLDNETKNKLLAILASIPEDELTMYIEMEADNSNLVTDTDIKTFIQQKDTYVPKVTWWSEVVSDNIKSTSNEKEFNVTGADKTIKLSDESTINIQKNNTEKSKKQFNDLNDKLPNLKSVFQSNPKILATLSNLENLYKERLNLTENETTLEKTEEIQNKILSEINNYFSNKENAKEFFQTLNEKNPALYKETYNAVIAISPELAQNFTTWWIPNEPYNVEKLDWGKSDDKTIISQFPNAKPEEIEKRWNLVSYWDKTIDIKTGKAYISWEKWYAIETSMKVPNSLDLRVKYQKERLETLEEIKTNEKILTLVERKQTLKQNLEKLKSQKSSEWQNAQDLQIDIEINTLSKELEAINEKLKTIIPGYKEEQDEMFIRFLEEKIIQWKEKLISLKENFDFEMKELLDAGKDEIITRDKNVRETIDFLDDLWITNINQNDLQKIINRINILPQAYGFSKKIDLKVWFQWTPTDALQQKKEFFKLFSKVYEKMNFIPPVNENIIQWFTKDERLKNDTIFKQKLEDIWVTKGGAIQIETMMSLLWEKPKERERKYPGKPTPEKKAPHTVEVK